MKKIVFGFIIMLLVGGGTLLIMHKKAKLAAAPAPTARPTPVRTAMAKIGTIIDSRNYLARLESWQTVELASQIAGRLVKVVPREGDTVRKGQILAVLEDAELRNQLAEAETTLRTLKRNVAYWEKEMERDLILNKEGAIAQAVADATADRLNDARGALSVQQKKCNVLTARLAYTRIKSPFSGIVSRRLADPGDLAVPGITLLVVEDRSRVKVCFEIPQPDIPHVYPGTSIRLQTETGSHSLTVSRLHPVLNANRTLTAEAYVPAAISLRSGSYYPVEVVFSKLENAVLVPEESLIAAPNGKKAVITIEHGKTAVHPVKVSLVCKGEAAVLGIAPNTLVVRSTYLGWNRLANGKPIEVIQ